MKSLEVRSVGKRFGSTVAVADVSLRTEPGETLAILGPSGCGKSTLLRIIAGLERPDTGSVLWDGVDITDVPPHLREFGFMFQGYALFPHRTVGQNVEFGLRMHKVPANERVRRVREALEMVDMAAFADRSARDMCLGSRSFRPGAAGLLRGALPRRPGRSPPSSASRSSSARSPTTPG